MKEYKQGYQKLETYRQFKRLLQEAGIEASGLEVGSAGSSQHLIILDGKLIGFYRYASGNFEATNGYKYSWKKELLTYPDGSTESVTFAEALQIIVCMINQYNT